VTFLVLSHVEFDIRGHNTVASKDLAEIERDALAADEARPGTYIASWGAYKGEIIVRIL
jgi:hypothetical protein